MEVRRELAQRAEDDRRRRELGRDVAQAQKLVAIWNSRASRKARPSFYPTIETALLAETPWLVYHCPACQLIGEVDVRTLDRHDHDSGKPWHKTTSGPSPCIASAFSNKADYP